jgi:hypothetical protein
MQPYFAQNCQTFLSLLFSLSLYLSFSLSPNLSLSLHAKMLSYFALPEEFRIIQQFAEIPFNYIPTRGSVRCARIITL